MEPDGIDADGVVDIRRIVEKPAREVAPSNLAVIGRYVFTPEIFDALDRIEPGLGGELQLTDAIALPLGEQKVYGLPCQGGRFDVGQKLDFLRANIELALDRDDLGPAFAESLRELDAAARHRPSEASSSGTTPRRVAAAGLPGGPQRRR